MTTTDTIRDIFREFYELSYKGSSVNKQQFKDSCILSNSYMLLRQQENGDYIHFLCNGNSIFIPIDWINVFSSLNVYDGNRIFMEYDILNTDNKVSKLCFLMTYLVYLIDSLGSRDFGNEILDTLDNISKIGTGEFRDWIKKTYELDFPPLEYRFPDELIKV